MRAGPEVRVAVDVGGTFTDIALMADNGVLHESKISTTPDDPSIAVVDGLIALLDELKIAPSAVAEVLHGTTVGSNTILQRKGARTGLITTRGFRDVLEIGRIRMPDMFDLTWDKPKPLVPRRHRLEVTERIAADGSVVVPLSEADVISAAEALLADGVEAIAICFLNSYRNPAHEQQAEAILKARFPDLAVSASYAVLPEMKEYERTSTTVVNAYLLAAMRSYLRRLEQRLAAAGIAAPILVMTSNGGMLPAATAGDRPVMVVASGPAGGVIGAARLGAALSETDIIVFDMGGTTAKAVIIEDGRPSMTSEYEFRDGMSTSSRFIKAGGYMLKVPAIDIAEVGAGGGSIAGIDAGGLLKVGPESAGAVPGPACYSLGNSRPTVTDANVVLGMVNPKSLAGGRLAIERRLAEEAIREHVAMPLGLSLEDAAHGIRAVANAAMARAIRAVTVERGRDPRDFTMMAFGGNGGTHAVDVARQLGVRKIIIPPLAGVFSAVGMLAADVEHTALATVMRLLDTITPTELGEIMDGLAADVSARLAAEGYTGNQAELAWQAEVRHEGQATELGEIMDGLAADVSARLAAEGYIGDQAELAWQAEVRHEGQATELPVPFEATGDRFGQIRERFFAEYLKTYGYRDQTPLELVKVTVVGRGLRRNRLDFSNMRIDQRPGAARSGHRLVSFTRGEPAVETEIVPRAAVGSEPRRGPLIVEEFDATIVVPPDTSISRDRTGNIVLEIGGQA